MRLPIGESLMSERTYRLIFSLCMLVILAAFMYAFYVVSEDSQAKQACIDVYRVCVETTEGWRPYAG